ncbi:HNH endonuclease [Salmonella enterica]|nr:HNH endonuclease [Salmonella enterica]EDO5297607.1 HNH endonuclease [Salmonella enterica subsp. houtenae serovar 40:z4,z24:-]EDX6935530.1 HNH endonuclease [Salmonella enterica subsp. houtenae serovar 40:z4,z24:-]EIF7321235.1 HNH endonuclease [Salmonella enterica]
MLSINTLRELLYYDESTGIFTWKKDRRGIVRPGRTAGCVNGRGYCVLRVHGVLYASHRLAWFYVHGDWPNGEIDHINGCKTDNRINNLRVATRNQNARNVGLTRKNKSGVKNVHWNNGHNKYRACIEVDQKEIHLGYFTNISEAETAVKSARIKYHGEFACHK